MKAIYKCLEKENFSLAVCVLPSRSDSLKNDYGWLLIYRMYLAEVSTSCLMRQAADTSRLGGTSAREILSCVMFKIL